MRVFARTEAQQAAGGPALRAPGLELFFWQLKKSPAPRRVHGRKWRSCWACWRLRPRAPLVHVYAAADARDAALAAGRGGAVMQPRRCRGLGGDAGQAALMRAAGS